MTSSRQNFVEAQKCDFARLNFAHHPIQISNAPFGSLPLTYIGHSPVGEVVVHNSYVYVDQGISVHSANRLRTIGPTVLQHTEFSYWLKGVVGARERLSAAAAGDGLAGRRARIEREAGASLDILGHQGGVPR